jgi:hypothetical protein
MTTSGGKSPGAAGTRSFLQAIESLLEESFSPKADYLTPSVKAFGDLAVADRFFSNPETGCAGCRR